jgi:hypothetical protein
MPGVLKKDASNLLASRLLVQKACRPVICCRRVSNKKLLALAPDDETARLMEAAILQAMHRGDEAIARWRRFAPRRTAERAWEPCCRSRSFTWRRRSCLKLHAKSRRRRRRRPTTQPCWCPLLVAGGARQDRGVAGLGEAAAEASAQPSGILLRRRGSAGTGKEANLREAVGLLRRASELDLRMKRSPEGGRHLRALHRGTRQLPVWRRFRTTGKGRTSLGAMLLLAQLYLDKKDLPQAARHSRRLRSRRRQPAVLSARFSWLAAQDKIEELLALAKQRPRRPPNRLESCWPPVGLWPARVKSPTCDEAIGLLRRASESNPENPVVPRLGGELPTSQGLRVGGRRLSCAAQDSSR